jgi:hypothetical protein
VGPAGGTQKKHCLHQVNTIQKVANPIWKGLSENGMFRITIFAT